MNYADRVRAAKGLPDALLILAEAADEILGARALEPAAVWYQPGTDSWAPPLPGQRVVPEPWETQAAAERRVHVGLWNADGYDVIRSPIDKDEVAAAQRAVHEAEIDFEKARAEGDISEGLLRELQAAQGRLRLAQDPGDILVNSGEVVGGPRELATDGGIESHIVDLPAADAARQLKRREFAVALDLPGFFEPVMRATPLQRAQIIDTYVKGGPLWLWPRRDILDAMPLSAKRVMVADVLQDSQRIGWDFGRDVLKEADEEGSALAVAQDNIRGISDAGAPPYKGKD